jgi:hypothetical protein
MKRAIASYWLGVMSCAVGCGGDGADVCGHGEPGCDTSAAAIDGYRAKICDYGEPACNACADDLIAQVAGDAALNIENAYTTFGFPGSIQGPGVHVQGVSRLPDWNDQGRMIITDSGSSSGCRLAFQEITDADEALYSTSTNLRDAVSFDIRNVVAYGDHAHPGGIQTQGDLVAVAMEGGAAEYGAVYFLRVSGSEIAYAGTLHLNGSQGEMYQGEQNAAATVGLIKLETEKFLVAVSGARHGAQGIWFYESTEDEIAADTSWDYLSFYEPTCTSFGGLDDECFAGASGGLALVADCAGDIYLLVMHGTERSGGDEYEYLQVFRVSKNESGEIALSKVAQQQDRLVLPPSRSTSFRWAGGAYVSRNNRLAIINTEPGAGLGDIGHNDHVDGDVYLGGPLGSESIESKRSALDPSPRPTALR